MRFLYLIQLCLVIALAGCTNQEADTQAADGSVIVPQAGVATEATAEANAAIAERLPLDNRIDFENAERGFLAKIEADEILNEDGSVAWSNTRFDFLEGAAPDTVNPSLWRQGQLNRIHGLFEVTDRIYQIRGYDLSTMTLIAGDTGWIIVDPLLTPATSRAGLALANETLGARPVMAVIFTHSHADHFGGVRGVLSEEDIATRGAQIVAPAGFTIEAVSENVLAGTYMTRRANFQFGTAVPPGPEGQVGTGLGQALSVGTVGLIEPTVELSGDGEQLTLDGVLFEFIDAGETEAPSEFMFYLPQFRALSGAEVVTGTFHNVLTPRGAQVRNTLKWSQVIDDVLVRYGDRSDVLFASHHWPVWSVDAVRMRLQNHRDTYRFVHDQTLRGANLGGTMIEISETIGEPDFAASDFSVRGYYGTMNHNSKAVYQRYFGWWDGVPASYNALPPEEEALSYVEAMGGVDETIRKGQNAFEAGNYRWAAKLLNHVVFAAPENETARLWLAASYEQLGFQAESGAWRNYYLMGALELRDGPPDAQNVSVGSPELLRAVPTPLLFDSMAVRFNPEKMSADPFILTFRFPDRDEAISVHVTRNVAFPRVGVDDAARATLIVDRADFDRLILGEARMGALISRGRLQVEGDPAAPADFFAALDTFDPVFNIIEP